MIITGLHLKKELVINMGNFESYRLSMEIDIQTDSPETDTQKGFKWITGQMKKEMGKLKIPENSFAYFNKPAAAAPFPPEHPAETYEDLEGEAGFTRNMEGRD